VSFNCVNKEFHWMNCTTITTTFEGILDLVHVFLSLLHKISPVSLVVFVYVNKFWHNQVTRYAIKYNSCECWSKINRQLCCDHIAGEGFLEVLKWARQNGCEWDSLTCSRAASNG
jgi:hypothetical protein